MIAQVVFDLPLDGPFDYLIPEQLVSRVLVGTRVKVSFGPKVQVGFVIGLIAQSVFSKLKSIQSLCDTSAIFNGLDLNFAREFCAYYGCSLGEALGTILRNKTDHKPSVQRNHRSLISLCRCHPNSYAAKIKETINSYRQSKNDASFLIIVPDIFRGVTLSGQLKGTGSIKIGMRSSVFECDGGHDCVIMIDEEDSSYKQEQTPMYETRQVLLMRCEMYGFDLFFMGISPSVELMSMAADDQIKLIEGQASGVPVAKVVDLSNYKFVPGMLSPPVRDALETALKAGKKSILVLNRKGSYRLTRCVECAEVLKCSHCDSPLIYSRSAGKYLCRHCTYTAPGDTVCPKCHKPSWKSIGIGVEQLQTELKKQFPQAKILAFERATKIVGGEAPSAGRQESLPDCDILISTSVVLRFQGRWQASVAAFIDFDAELNRLDMRSAFNAFSLALHISSMTLDSVFIQTRNSNHYVLEDLSRGKIQGFYDEDLKLRKEFGFSPFKHWVKISWRGKLEKPTHEAALQVYNALNQSASGNLAITPPLADTVARKRDWFRFNVMVQSDQVPQAVAFIKSTLTKIKRPSRVIVTLNVDP